ncbi:MAG: class I SAM-dependent methyltransferase, partial [Halobacteriales archaeon]|nr:class I SAM-dependent methyltransferase [Halobacteriales archaeon]
MPALLSVATATPPNRMGQAERAHEVQSLFEGIADRYDQPAQAFGLLRYRAWHRQVAKRVAQARPQRVLDMCSGTGAIAAEVAARTSAVLVCADLTRGMLKQAVQRPT